MMKEPRMTSPEQPKIEIEQTNIPQAEIDTFIETQMMRDTPNLNEMVEKIIAEQFHVESSSIKTLGGGWDVTPPGGDAYKDISVDVDRYTFDKATGTARLTLVAKSKFIPEDPKDQISWKKNYLFTISPEKLIEIQERLRAQDDQERAEREAEDRLRKELLPGFFAFAEIHQDERLTSDQCAEIATFIKEFAGGPLKEDETIQLIYAKRGETFSAWQLVKYHGDSVVDRFEFQEE